MSNKPASEKYCSLMYVCMWKSKNYSIRIMATMLLFQTRIIIAIT